MTQKIAKSPQLLAGQLTQYQYSSENQLLGIKVFPSALTNSPSWAVSYTYDALGRRVEKAITSVTNQSQNYTRRYLYDSQNIVAELNGNNEVLAHYTFNNLNDDDVLAVSIMDAGVTAGLAPSSGQYHYLKDAQGSVVDVVNKNGGAIQHFIYSAFGILLGIKDAQANDVTSSPPLATSFGFTGRELDGESGLMYYRARYYDPLIGRFLQKDPAPGKMDQPSTLVNKYIYAGNNPASFSDPSGRDFWGDITDAIKDVLVTGLAGLVLFTAFFTPIGLIAGLINPALTFSYVLAALNLCVLGQVANYLISDAQNGWNGGSFASLTTKTNSHNGYTGLVVINSAIPGLTAGEGGFTPGPISFLQPGAENNQNLIDHELGHQIQYGKDGGWQYAIDGIQNGNGKITSAQGVDEPTLFECEASYDGGSYAGYNANWCHQFGL